jgi:all-trans-retinol 13,14-reductase
MHMWDAIVIGSGIGGLAAAAALARKGRRVLVLEQHTVAGGLTQTFRRGDWHFAPGVHYIGGVAPQPGPAGRFGRLLAWLTHDALRFTPCANPYDIVRLPGFEFGIPHPENAYRDALLARFPQEAAAIAGWFQACEAARGAAFSLFAQHAAPAWAAWILRQWHHDGAGQWARRTLAEELARVNDPRLRAVLGARWADYGAPPAQAPFLEHALVTGSYDAGAWYPVGGPGRFAAALVPVIEAAGGEVRLDCDVRQIHAATGHVCGVEFTSGPRRLREDAQHVISAMGVANTVACLPPTEAAGWQGTVRGLAPGLSCIAMYLGFDGDIAAAGASSANQWIYESEDIGAVWKHPQREDAPGLFVSFPSLKDPGCAGKPTAELVVAADAAPFAPWFGQDAAHRPGGYGEFKAAIEQRLLAQFGRHFPMLKPLLRFHELATPVTQQRYVRSPQGAMYGIEMSAERLTTPALRVRTPLQGLLLAGQDVTSPGVEGAFMGGLLAAAALEPSLWPMLQSA